MERPKVRSIIVGRRCRNSMARVRRFITGCLCLVLLLPVEGRSEKSLLQRDFESLFSAHSLSMAVAGVGLAGFAHQWDDDIKGEVEDNAVLEGVLKVGNFYGSSTYGLSTMFGVWSIARIARRPELQAVSSEMLRALILANSAVTPMKLIVGRQRPDGSNSLSFPSGHSANAFALAAVLSRRYGKGVGIPLYAFTAVVPTARIHDRHHFFSDVVAGAILGSIAGCAVTRQEAEEQVVTWVPVYTTRGWMLQARWHY